MRGREETRERRRAFRRVALSLLVCLGQTFAAVAWLSAEGPVEWIYAYCLAVESLFLLRFIRSRLFSADGPVWAAIDRIAGVGLGLLFLFGAGVIVIGLDITPASAYLAWFQLVQEGVAGGTLAYMFSVKFAYFGALFGGLLLSGSIAFSLLNLAAIDLLICAVLLGKPGLAAVGAALFLIAVARYAVRRAGRRKARAGMAMLQVTLVSALIALPLWAAHPRNHLIDDLFAVRMEGFVAGIFPNFPFLYNVPGYGYSLESAQIGERPALTSRPVFQVAAPAGATVYIRTGVYDTYTGSGWELSHTAQRGGEQDVSFFESMVDTVPPVPSEELSFKVLIDFYSSLPHTLGTLAFRFPSEQTPDASLASLNTGFILGTPLRRGTTIVDVVASPASRLKPILFTPPQARGDSASSRRSSVNGFEGSGSDRAGIDFGVDRSGRGDASFDPRGIEEGGPRAVYRYRQRIASESDTYGLQLGRYVLTPWERRADLETGDLPKRLVLLARELGAGKTETETIDSIRNYLVDNYQYSLDTRPGGPYKDAVSDFLFASKKGFCVQFASAFVILARIDGIPARYVTGFLAELPPHETGMTVTGLSAHAWAETWSDRRGWVTQEATPPMLAAASGNPNVLADYNPTDSRYTQRQLEAVLGGRLAPSAAAQPTQPANLSKDLTRFTDRFAGLRRTALPVSAGIVALALIAWLALRRFSPAESRLKRVVRKIAKQSRGRGYPDPSQGGWREWSRELEYRFPERALVARRAASVIHRSFFADGRGGFRTPRRDIDFLQRLYRKMLRGRRGGARAPAQAARVSSKN